MTEQFSLAASWRRIAEDLGIEVLYESTVSLPGGAHLVVPVLVVSFGALRGMVVVSEYATVKAVRTELVEAGYGFSVMGAEDPSRPYDRESAITMLADWGWSGLASERPDWLPSES